MQVGIDEAGKGPVIGPLCVAGVCIDDDAERRLRILGVDDSKKLSAKKREQLSYQIKKYVNEYTILEVCASQIDELRKIMTMNDIMVMCFAKVLQNISSDFNYVYMDAADVYESRFAIKVRQEYLKNLNEKIENENFSKINFSAKHRADSLNIAVSAASIIAKVRRDEIIEEIKVKENVDFGSGYPSDPKTKSFLSDWAKEHNEFPDFVRKSWKTASNIIPFEDNLFIDMQ
ncbi:MAG: ribonuclease HII [Methanosarcinaceae archaeon]|nr:ribonuclease HII [Methanosarcinaceae archaeon]